MSTRCLLLLAVASFGGGCAKPTPAPQPDAQRAISTQPDAAPAAAATECAHDRDCELITDGCCDCNQGGRRISVPVGKSTKKDCAGIMCPQFVSIDPSCLAVARAYCAAGKCAITGIDDKPGEQPSRRFGPGPSPGDRRAPPRR